MVATTTETREAEGAAQLINTVCMPIIALSCFTDVI